jgi:hypothetical protein
MRTADDTAGMEAKCPGCSAMFTIPAAGTTEGGCLPSLQSPAGPPSVAPVTPAPSPGAGVNPSQSPATMLPEPRIAIVYDTSFLMVDNYHRLTVDRTHCGLVEFVPDEVTRELARHLEDEEKAPPARAARKRVAELIDGGAQEPAIAGLAEVKLGNALGCDSKVDAKLLSFVQQLASSGQYALVYLATDDGGLMNDVVRLKKTGLNVRYVTKDNLLTFAGEISELCRWEQQRRKQNEKRVMVGFAITPTAMAIVAYWVICETGWTWGWWILWPLIVWSILGWWIMLLNYDSSD